MTTAQQVLKEQTVLRLFEQGKVSNGYAARMLGLTRYQFIDLMAKHRVPLFNHAQEELNREFQAAAELTRSLKAGGQEETVIIVSNSTPLIALARIGSLDLLKSLFTTITIPQTVYHEVVTSGPTRPSAQAVGAANWIVTRAVTNRRAVTPLMNSASLDRGESEAILIALELKAS